MSAISLSLTSSSSASLQHFTPAEGRNSTSGSEGTAASEFGSECDTDHPMAAEGERRAAPKRRPCLSAPPPPRYPTATHSPRLHKEYHALACSEEDTATGDYDDVEECEGEGGGGGKRRRRWRTCL